MSKDKVICVTNKSQHELARTNRMATAAAQREMKRVVKADLILGIIQTDR
jgi:hypothetical protein